jgi:catechol 2,3-dioxygenase-like lactoylglutathione lyase family enzyme
MPPLCQIALSVRDLRRTSAWYADAFGLLPAGGQDVGGQAFSRLLSVPRAAAQVLWLVDKQDFFQLELFRFIEPSPRRRPPDRPGYSQLSIHVDDFEATLKRLTRLRSVPIDSISGPTGRRLARVRDPDGQMVEVTEHDQAPPAGRRVLARPEVPSAVRRITASVRSLRLARRFWIDTLGLLAEPPPDTPSSGASPSKITAWAGGIAVELVELTGVDDAEADDGRIWDFGIVNLALGGPDLDEYLTACERTHVAGYHHNGELRRPEVRATYLEDDQQFSVELLYRSPETAHLAGFVPATASPPSSPTHGE